MSSNQPDILSPSLSVPIKLHRLHAIGLAHVMACDYRAGQHALQHSFSWESILSTIWNLGVIKFATLMSPESFRASSCIDCMCS